MADATHWSRHQGGPVRSRCHHEIRGRQQYVKGDDCLFHSSCSRTPIVNDEPYTTEALADRCGVSVRTIHRWRKHPDFPAPVVESGRKDAGGGHAWSFVAVRCWLDQRDKWDWAMDRAFAADAGEGPLSEASGRVERLIEEAALRSDSARVRRAGVSARDSIGRLLRELQEDNRRRDERAEIERLKGQLGSARARLRKGPTPPISPANKRWREAQSERDAIRQWARAEGIGVMGRGAISMRVVRLYDEAHGAT